MQKKKKNTEKYLGKCERFFLLFLTEASSIFGSRVVESNRHKWSKQSLFDEGLSDRNVDYKLNGLAL